MKEKIKNLISDYEWAGIDAITFGDGKMVLLDIEFYNEGQYYISPIVDSTIDSYLKYNIDDLSPFDIFAKTEYSDYEVLVGDSSGEGNGIIYVMNKSDDSLLWFAFFENSESFKTVVVNDKGIVEATSNVGIVWQIPIENPLKIELNFPTADRADL